MSESARTILVDGYQPRSASGNYIEVVRDARTGQIISTAPKKLPKATSAIQSPSPKK